LAADGSEIDLGQKKDVLAIPTKKEQEYKNEVNDIDFLFAL
jgi:hypothetical protein